MSLWLRSGRRRSCILCIRALTYFNLVIPEAPETDLSCHVSISKPTLSTLTRAVNPNFFFSTCLRTAHQEGVLFITGDN